VSTEVKVPSLADLKDVDVERLNFGTDYQDCSLIASFFERCCHSIPTEAASFAPLTRQLQGTKNFANTAQKTLSSYIRAPGENPGAAVNPALALQALKIGDTTTATYGSDFGNQLLDWLKNCIPCQLRIVSYLELHPNLDLLGAFKTDIKEKLKMLMDLVNSLKNFDIYSDICELLKLLNFMCIPDLQRIITALMALLILQVPNLDGIVAFLQSLVSFIFAPIFMGLTSLLDQLGLLVVNPLQCIIDAIDEQMQKLNYQSESLAKAQESLDSFTNGLSMIKSQIIEAKQLLQQKIEFYINQVRKMIPQINFGNSSYLHLSFKKLQIVRMIGVVVGIIAMLSKGLSVCSNQGKSPEKSELDNFFNTYLNPNQPFIIFVDDTGNLQIQEKTGGLEEIASPSNENKKTPFFGKTINFDAEKTVKDPELRQAILETSNVVTKKADVVVQCNIRTTSEDASLVNQWIEELNKR
jgi:hypothetical protein